MADLPPEDYPDSPIYPPAGAWIRAPAIGSGRPRNQSTTRGMENRVDHLRHDRLACWPILYWERIAADGQWVPL